MRIRTKEKKDIEADVYEKATGKIIADLEKGKLSWLKLWSSGDLEGKITKPLRHNGLPDRPPLLWTRV